MRLSFRYNSLEELGFTLFSGPNPIAKYDEKGGRGGEGEGERKGKGCRWEEEKGGGWNGERGKERKGDSVKICLATKKVGCVIRMGLILGRNILRMHVERLIDETCFCPSRNL